MQIEVLSSVWQELALAITTLEQYGFSSHCWAMRMLSDLIVFLGLFSSAEGKSLGGMEIGSGKREKKGKKREKSLSEHLHEQSRN